jgi:long-chain fatty acid transport protein
MSSILRTSLRLSAAAAALVVAASAANASSFAIRAGQSAEGLGMAFAGAASGGIGLGSMAWNPAIITMFPGRTSNWNATYLNADASYNLDGPATVRTPFGNLPITSPLVGGGTNTGSGGIGLNGAFIPASFNAWQVTDRLWVGLTNTAPFGLRSKPSNQFYFGQTYGRSATVRTVNISPTIGFAINDWISIGAALQIQYAHVDLKQALGVGATAGNLQLRGDSYDFGYRIGVTLRPLPGTTIGIAYRSGIDQSIRGQGRLPTPVGIQVTPVSLNLPLPGSVVVGVSHQINEQWQAHLGVEWTNWGRFNRLPVRDLQRGGLYTVGGNPVQLNFEYKDSWFFSGGVEYKWNQALTLRAGLAYELSAIDERVRTVFISDNDRLWLSAGASYQFSDQLSADLGYTYIAVNKARINYLGNHPQQGPVQFSAAADPKIHIVSVGLTYRWDAPARPQQPMVRKN